MPDRMNPKQQPKKPARQDDTLPDGPRPGERQPTGQPTRPGKHDAEKEFPGLGDEDEDLE